MIFTQHYDSPLGGILLAADEIGLTGLWFDGQKYFARGLPAERIHRETPALSQARCWLDLYFAGQAPGFLPPLHPVGTEFRRAVWEILLQIPYGQTVTYGGIAQQLAKDPGCRPRPWAEPSAIMRSPLSVPATVWWGPAEASPAMPAAWTKR